MIRYTCGVLISLSALGLLGCQGDSPDALIASAQSYLTKHDNKGAIIQLKNALQKAPNSGQARFMLGSALLDSGDPSSAEVELAKALQLNHPKQLVVPPLAAAMVMQGKAKEVVDQYGAAEFAEAAATASLKTSLAAAHARLGNMDRARVDLAAALKADPTYQPGRVLQARFAAGGGDSDGALKIIDAILAENPGQVDAWKLKGDLLYFSKGDLAKSIEAYSTALRLKPEMLEAHSSIMAVLIAQKDYSAAQARLQDFKKAVPGNGEAKYYDALLAYFRKDFGASREMAQQLLTIAPENSKVLYLAGVVELQANSLLQAENYLGKALQKVPRNAAVLKALSQVYLRTGQPAKVLGALLPYADQGSPDPEILALVARAHLANGDIKEAESYFVRASKLDPKDMGTRTALALTQLAKGNSEAAFGELQTIASSDTGTTADLALISALLQRKDVDGALKAIAALEHKDPTNPLPAALRGRVEMARGDASAARASFERALSLSPSYFPAVAALSTLDMRDKKPDAARQRFDALLAKDPKNLQALLAIAQMRMQSGASKEEVADLLGRAIQLNPTEPMPRLLLIERHLKTGDAAKALVAAQEAVATLPQNAPLLDALGRAQMAAGDNNQAVATFSKLQELEPQSQQPLLRLAEAYVALKQNDAAVQSLKRALVLEPNSAAAQRGLISLKAATGQAKESIAMARQMQDERGNDPIGFALEGEIEARLKDWDAAASAYRSGLKKVKSTGLAVSLHRVLVAGNKQADADHFAAEWTKGNPKDDVFIFYLADTALNRKDYATAETQYRAFIALRPDSPIALNNLAWVTAQLHKPGAVGYAERANALAPNQPALMDTLAMLLSEDNQTAKALALQKKAVSLAPNLPSLRLNLAKLLMKSGDKAQAKTELLALSQLGDKLPERAEVEQLLKAL